MTNRFYLHARRLGRKAVLVTSSFRNFDVLDTLTVWGHSKRRQNIKLWRYYNSWCSWRFYVCMPSLNRGHSKRLHIIKRWRYYNSWCSRRFYVCMPNLECIEQKVLNLFIEIWTYCSTQLKLHITTYILACTYINIGASPHVQILGRFPCWALQDACR